jgi:hypothetical protein
MSRLAIAAVIAAPFGFAFGCLTTVVPLAIAVIALVDISLSKGARRGRWLAVLAIVLTFVIPLVEVIGGMEVLDRVPALVNIRARNIASSINDYFAQIGEKLLLYRGSHEGRLPADLQTFYEEDPERTKSTWIFGIPDDTKPDESRIAETGHLYYFPLKEGDAEGAALYPPDAPVAWEKYPVSPEGKVSVLRANGKASMMSVDELKTEIARYAEVYLKSPELPGKPRKLAPL